MNDQEKTEENIKFLINLFENKEVKVRKKARLILVAKGTYAVPFLISALQHSAINKVRWEAAKTLGSIGDAEAIPALVQALDNGESDVAWLAGEALKKFKKIAWKELLDAIIDRGAESIMLRHGARHILRNQKEEGFNDLLSMLRKSLITGAVPESAALAAYKILEKMREQGENNKKSAKSVKIVKIKP